MPDSAPSSVGSNFPEIWAVADGIPGWLTQEQAELLHDQAEELTDGAVAVEIGSHRGRSTVVLARALQANGGRLIAIDPFVEGRMFGGPSTRDDFERNIASARVDDVVDLVADYSTAARTAWTAPFQLLYIDGKHDFWTLSDDLRWRQHLPHGGPVLVHDCFSSIGVTLGILRHVLFSADLRYERRVGSLALFRVGRPTPGDRWRILRELPWWVRNVGLKVLLRLGLRPVARLLGHDSPYDPY